jgi:uncharacterized protein (TIRG00374 family)
MRLQHSRVLLFLKLAVAASIFYILMHQSMLNMALLLELVHQPVSVLALVVLFIINIMLSAWRWYVINRAHEFTFSFKQTLTSIYIGLAYNNILPGSVSGDFVRINHLFQWSPEKKMRGVLTVVLDRAVGLLGVLAVLFMLSTFYLGLMETNSTLLFIAKIVFLSVGIILIGAASVLLMPARFLSAFSVGERKWQKTVFSLISFARKSRPVLLASLLISILIQWVITLMIFVIARALGLTKISYLKTLLANGMTQIISLLPIVPGGMGVGEAAFGHTLILLSQSGVLAYSTVYLGYRLTNMLFCIPALMLKSPRQPLPNATDVGMAFSSGDAVV